MITSIKGMIMSALSTSVIASSSLGVSYYASIETIENKLKEKLLPIEGFDSEWTELAKSINGKDIPNLNKKDKDGLKLWCQEQVKKTYKSMFNNEDTNTKTLVETHCVLTFKSKFGGDEKIFKNAEDSEIESKLKKLKTKQTSEQKLDSELSNLQIQDTNNSKETKTALFDWCNSKYENGYKGETENQFSLAKELCSK